MTAPGFDVWLGERHLRHRTEDQVTGMAERLPPREPARHPKRQFLSVDSPPLNAYAGSRSRRLVLSSHKPRSSDGGCSMTSNDMPKITIYNWSTRTQGATRDQNSRTVERAPWLG